MSEGTPSKVLSEHTGGVGVLVEMDSTATQPEKALLPILRTELSKETLTIPEQFSKALSPVEIS